MVSVMQESYGDEEEEETRCVCGETEPQDGSDLFIQCESCGVWQHGYCVGITAEVTPEKYWCERCKPNLHYSYITGLKKERSLYKPLLDLDNIKRNKMVIVHEYEEDQKLKDREKATLKAREEKQYDILLQKVLQESKQNDIVKTPLPLPLPLQNSPSPKINMNEQISLNEMRSRLLAIMEFVSQTRSEITNDQCQKSFLTEFTENKQFTDKIDKILLQNDQNLSLIDDLNKNLIHWGQKYG